MTRRSGFDGRTCVLGKIRGYRQWHPRFGNLFSLMDEIPWFVEMKAKCLTTHYNNFFTPSEANSPLDYNYYAEPTQTACRCSAPEFTCTCGIYSMARPYDDWSSTDFYVKGVVSNWGKVVVGDRGFRSEFAKMEAVTLPLEPPTTMVASAGCLSGIPHSIEYYRRHFPEPSGFSKKYPGVAIYRTVVDMMADYPPEDYSELMKRDETYRDRYQLPYDEVDEAKSDSAYVAYITARKKGIFY